MNDQKKTTLKNASDDFSTIRYDGTVASPESIKIIHLGLAIKNKRKIELKIKGHTEVPQYQEGKSFEDRLLEFYKDSKKPSMIPHNQRHPHPHQSRKPTDASIKLYEPCHLIYHLDDGLEWCFSREYFPFTQDSSLVGMDVFWNPRHVSNKLEVLNYDRPAAGCRYATMIFDPANLGPDYVARFNLHVELIDEIAKQGDPIKLSSAFTPVILDPDVRYPGGSGP